ncbi:LacI family DNA-binding transcriptional regulator [Pseudactinotalea sp. Z1739]|uniref:LacI family DNA-binding transcriptional regulator n=1 Tax=Pseudactinotalea sp. Z1739 TaxID=3413028 RepID=UPI003C7BC867
MSRADSATPGQGRSRSRPGIKDVAALANVSWKTVSNVVNESAPVRPQTRARVEAAIAELGYRPTLSGRYLRQGRSRILGLAVADLRLPYFSDLAHAVIEAAGKRDYTVLIEETLAEVEQERHAADGFGVHLLDGLIYSPQSLDPEEIRRSGTTLPTVVLGEHGLAELTRDLALDRVLIDNVAAAREATQHLLDTGRRAIVFLGADPHPDPDPPHDQRRGSASGAGSLRRDGYLEAIGNAMTPTILPTTVYSRATGYDGISTFLAKSGTDHLDAIFCANDQLAIGVMAALREAGLRVPEDVAVLGWDGSEEGRFANPSLTSVTPDLQALSELAVDLLLDRIEGSAGPGKVHVLPHQIHVRDSTAPAR